MIHDSFRNRPGLLVSVRSAAEALAALDGGADFIDVKEPDRGSLGAADPATIAEVVRAVNGRATVTAAVGELLEIEGLTSPSIPAGVSLFKIGLARCRNIAKWPSRWRHAIAALSDRDMATNASPVAVVYADWRTADAPAPENILRAAVDIGCPALLIDTWDKSSGTLFDHWPIEELGPFLQLIRRHGLCIVLAGSLSGDGFAAAVRLGPDLVAVRAAACSAGRGGTVTRERVHALRQAMTAAEGAPNAYPAPNRKVQLPMNRRPVTFPLAKDFS
ncbi:MAG: (5-formylfuran-3-yl)methyl phosphate synthase [Planctomycetes bacterium]|nr:(5-formylfuran-3-yl)methyl phosphate synthase [Planctomycetota bacterium]